jgi:hypothetical protein
MEMYTSGLFALAGVLLAGLFTYGAARIGHDWNRARRHIRLLSEQVAAYHALEQAYMQALYAADSDQSSLRAIQTRMRDQVETTPGFERPRLTTKEARRIRRLYAL